jgi:aerobic-type carbon monoxide dehydrogenase small subunit (CoxS/CutS family)
MNQIDLEINGRQVRLRDRGASLLEALRDDLGIRSAKDGCSPQGQCGCCTVLVDGQPRVACVTPLRRMRGRAVTTIEGLDPDVGSRWGAAFCATGGSQCGFCTPGIVLRLEGLRQREAPVSDDTVRKSLLAHLCRCTGWHSIIEAWSEYGAPLVLVGRDLERAAARATIEGGVPQRVDPDVPVGGGGFADDAAPPDALVAVSDGRGGWVVGETLAEARSAAGKVQGRRAPGELRWPLDFPPGEWDGRLRTTWVEPAYLETDASWCEPGGEPASPLANGGAFGGKESSEAGAVARRLADEHGRPVRVLYSREDTVRLGPKRPPMAGGARGDGTGVMQVVRTPGIAGAVGRVVPGISVEEVDVPGPPTSASLRAAGWAEAVALVASARGQTAPVLSPSGAVAEAVVADDGVELSVRCGDILDEVVLRSYCLGAAHMALSWVWSEGIAVDEEGEVQDLTIRSFGILRAVDMPPVVVHIEPSDAEPVNGSDAVFAAVAAAAALAEGSPESWPSRRS